VPVLARVIEAAGISTVMVTMMPYWAERVGTPRTLGVEFPFGHPFGRGGEREEQLAVIRSALDVLRSATAPGAVEHFDRPWQGDTDEWRKRWQPSEPSPIIKLLRDRAQQHAQGRRAEQPGAAT
jgi:hypothetical protein